MEVFFDLKPGLQIKTGRAEKSDMADIARQTAQEFEAEFIAQMLAYSGLADALTKNGGEAVAGFSRFYLESLAENIVANGGFGIAQQIEEYIKFSNNYMQEEDNGELGKL